MREIILGKDAVKALKSLKDLDLVVKLAERYLKRNGRKPKR